MQRQKPGDQNIEKQKEQYLYFTNCEEKQQFVQRMLNQTFQLITGGNNQNDGDFTRGNEGV